MQPNLRLPKKLLHATLPLVYYLPLSRLPCHHTCARRRRRSFQYHATHLSPTKNATWLYFATVSPYQHTTDAATHADDLIFILRLLELPLYTFSTQNHYKPSPLLGL